MENAGKVGLFGAAGAIGQSIATALSAAGRNYRVIGRSRGSLEAAFGADLHAEIVRGIRTSRHRSPQRRRACKRQFIWSASRTTSSRPTRR